MIQGVSITLKKKTQSGTDDFNRPTYTTEDVTVNNVLVGVPTADDVNDAFTRYGKMVAYNLHLPKGDTSSWEDTDVVLPEPFAGTYHTIEWQGDQMYATDINHATNHYVSKEDLFFKNGCGRDEVLKAGLFRTAKAGMREDFVENLLRLVVQDPENGTDQGKTLYTCIYNLNKKTLKVFSFGDMDKSWDYKL